MNSVETSKRRNAPAMLFVLRAVAAKLVEISDSWPVTPRERLTESGDKAAYLLTVMTKNMRKSPYNICDNTKTRITHNE